MSHGDARCHNCGEPSVGSLPLDDSGLYVAVGDEVTEWGGVPGCAACIALHAVAGERCNEVLAAYETATESLGSRLDDAREALRKLARTIDDTLRGLER